MNPEFPKFPKKEEEAANVLKRATKENDAQRAQEGEADKTVAKILEDLEGEGIKLDIAEEDKNQSFS